MSPQQSKEQERARGAWQKVTAAKAKGKEFGQKYGQVAKSAPADIQTNGLGQSLAFWRAKGKGNRNDEHEVIYGDVSEWVMSQMKWTHEKGLLGKVMDEKTSTNQYRQATAEAMAFLQWLKRFAEAELSEEKGT